MIALLALALVQAAPAAADNDIVVTANKLRRLRISTLVKKGKVRACQVRVTSGDPDIDRTACEATVTCFNSGVTESEPLADCVETHVVAFVRKRSEG